MTGWKKNLLVGGGYFAFFLAAFIVCMFLTFDSGLLIENIRKQAAARNVTVNMDDISISPLLSVTVKNLEIAPQPAVENTEGLTPMVIKRLTVSPKLTRLPAMIMAARAGKQPPVAFSFSAQIDRGRIKGAIDEDQEKIIADLAIDDLPLDKVTLPAYYMEGLNLIGTIKSARFKLNVKDRVKPEDWTGGLNLSLDQIRVSDFKFYSYPVAGMRFDPGGTISAEIKGGNLVINGVKLTGDLSPDLKGTIALKRPLYQSIVDLSGSILISDDYKTAMPLIATLIPDSKSYSFKGTLGQLMPALKRLN